MRLDGLPKLSMGKLLKKQAKAAEQGKSGAVSQFLLPADEQSAARSQPREGPFHDPTMAVAAPRPPVLGDVLWPTVLARRGEHFQTQFGEGWRPPLREAAHDLCLQLAESGIAK